MSLAAMKQAGFTDGEIRVYTALLEIGESSTGPIIKKSEITGSKVYEILEKLKAKGLVSHVTKEKTKYFQAAPPKRILDYVEQKEQELRQNKEAIKELLPQLEARQQSSNLGSLEQGLRRIVP